MLCFEHVDVLVAAKVMVFLEKNGIILKLLILQYCFEVFLIEILLGELFNNKIALFYLSESLQEHLHVLLHFLRCLGLYFFRNALIVVQGTPSKCLHEELVLSGSPLGKALSQMPLVLKLDVFGHLLKLFLKPADLQAQLLQSTKVREKLELKVLSADVNGAIRQRLLGLSRHRILEKTRPLLHLGSCSLLVKLMEVARLALNRRLPLQPAATPRILRLLLSSLLHNEVLHLLFLFSEILILELKGINCL